MEQSRFIQKEKKEERIVRILSQDIEGKSKLYPGLTKIKGVSWAISNAVCHFLKLNKDKRIGELTSEELAKIADFIKHLKIHNFLLNRRFDPESGENKHLIGSDLELQKDFDIKRLKKIKSYRGIRHAAGLTVRGQRTKGNFRRNRKKGSGIKKKVKKSTD